MQLHQQGKWPWIKDRQGNKLDLRLVPAATSLSMDNCYLRDFREGWISIYNSHRQVGFGLAFDPRW